MKKRVIKDLSASIRQRLQQAAQISNRPFQEVLQYYAMERFLYRLSISAHAEKFVLKGALMMTVWGASSKRPTRDIDLLGRLPNRVEDIVSVFREVCSQVVEPDALAFDPSSIAGIAIKEDADYAGVRITFRGSLQNIRLPMQIDVGFGDIIIPNATLAEYPTILAQSAPKLLGYSRETTIAEKFEAMVKLGLLNSRLKDYYDIWLLSRQFDFEGVILASAIDKTFSTRRTTVTPDPTALTSAFATNPVKVTQWKGFLRKSGIEGAPLDLITVCEAITTFLSEPATAVRDGQIFVKKWRAGGFWA